MKAITDFLLSHPLISISPLERAAGCPPLTIQAVLAGNKPAIPEKWAWQIIVVLCEYGFAVQGWRFTYDVDTDCFFVEKAIDRPPIITEHKDKTGIWLEYQIGHYREVISSEPELLNFLKRN